MRQLFEFYARMYFQLLKTKNVQTVQLSYRTGGHSDGLTKSSVGVACAQSNNPHVPAGYSFDFVFADCAGEVGGPGDQVLALELLLVLAL